MSHMLATELTAVPLIWHHSSRRLWGQVDYIRPLYSKEIQQWHMTMGSTGDPRCHQHYRMKEGSIEGTAEVQAWI